MDVNHFRWCERSSSGQQMKNTCDNCSVRSFGDQVLFTPTQPVQFLDEEHIAEKIQTMMKVLFEYGGVGVAANQCAEILAPAPSIMIAGVNNPESLLRAQARYPDRLIPEAQVYINPTILQRSLETYFPGEGCISIPCTFRGKVARHKWIVMQYQNIHGELFENKFTDFTAHILQHECDHLEGVVFMHKLINDMRPSQRNEFSAIIDEILSNPIPLDQQCSKPTLAIDRDESGKLLFDKELIKITLSGLTNTVLLALKHSC